MLGNKAVTPRLKAVCANTGLPEFTQLVFSALFVLGGFSSFWLLLTFCDLHR